MHLFYYRRRGTENKGGLVSQITRIAGVAGVMVSIVAFQAVDPGSIPGPRSLFDETEWTRKCDVRDACLA